jgi:hypothetical protein
LGDYSLLAPYHPSGRQGNINSKQKNDAKYTHFSGRFEICSGAPVLYRAHRLMEEVQGFHKATKCRHRASTCSDRHQSDMSTPILGVYFIVDLLKKGLSCPNKIGV